MPAPPLRRSRSFSTVSSFQSPIPAYCAGRTRQARRTYLPLALFRVTDTPVVTILTPGKFQSGMAEVSPCAAEKYNHPGAFHYNVSLQEDSEELRRALRVPN